MALPACTRMQAVKFREEQLFLADTSATACSIFFNAMHAYLRHKMNGTVTNCSNVHVQPGCPPSPCGICRASVHTLTCQCFVRIKIEFHFCCRRVSQGQYRGGHWLLKRINWQLCSCKTGKKICWKLEILLVWVGMKKFFCSPPPLLNCQPLMLWDVTTPVSRWSWRALLELLLQWTRALISHRAPTITRRRISQLQVINWQAAPVQVLSIPFLASFRSHGRCSVNMAWLTTLGTERVQTPNQTGKILVRFITSEWWLGDCYRQMPLIIQCHFLDYGWTIYNSLALQCKHLKVLY